MDSSPIHSQVLSLHPLSSLLRDPLLPPLYTLIRDYAYPALNPLHHGAIPDDPKYFDLYDEQLTQQLLLFQDGPPWAEDLSPTREFADEINQRAVALYPFEAENVNEIALVAGQEIYVRYRHGQGWLVAEDPGTGENGLVPEGYVRFGDEGAEGEWEDEEEVMAGQTPC